MKILLFGGGLGNQIFEYAFYLYIKKRFLKSKIYGVYNKRWLNEHNGLEINRVFDIELPKSSLFTDLISAFLYLYKKINPKSGILDLNTRRCDNINALFFNSYKYTKEFIPPKKDWIRFSTVELDAKNRQTLDDIEKSNSVFIHVRRGDYFSPKYRKSYEGTCTLEYYKRALNLVTEKVQNPNYFIFSDDIEWCKSNLPITNATFVNWNHGEKSFIDMYLMANCKNGIMANSTFSFWGSMLIKEKDLIIYPLHWINSEKGQPDIFMEDWVSL